MKKISERIPLKKLLAFSLIIDCSLLAVVPFVTGEQTIQVRIESFQELNLLRGEHYLYVNATEDVASFHIRYSFPLDYHYQIPIMLEILNDSSADIPNYQIQNDSFPPNKVINLTLGSMNKGTMVSLHFYCWVLFNNTNYSELSNMLKSQNNLSFLQKQDIDFHHAMLFKQIISLSKLKHWK